MQYGTTDRLLASFPQKHKTDISPIFYLAELKPMVSVVYSDIS